MIYSIMIIKKYSSLIIEYVYIKIPSCCYIGFKKGSKGEEWIASNELTSYSYKI
jgi:hypothetical protein